MVHNNFQAYRLDIDNSNADDKIDLNVDNEIYSDKWGNTATLDNGIQLNHSSSTLVGIIECSSPRASYFGDYKYIEFVSDFPYNRHFSDDLDDCHNNPTLLPDIEECCQEEVFGDFFKVHYLDFKFIDEIKIEYPEEEKKYSRNYITTNKTYKSREWKRVFKTFNKLLYKKYNTYKKLPDNSYVFVRPPNWILSYLRECNSRSHDC